MVVVPIALRVFDVLLQLDDRALTEVMKKLFKNYKKWCKYLARKSSLWWGDFCFSIDFWLHSNHESDQLLFFFPLLFTLSSFCMSASVFFFFEDPTLLSLFND